MFVALQYSLKTKILGPNRDEVIREWKQIVGEIRNLPPPTTNPLDFFKNLNWKVRNKYAKYYTRGS
jgi:hypothetical protein